MKFLKFAGCSFLVLSIGITFNAIRFQYGIENAFWRTIMIPFEGTVWATDFKESEFSKIRLGMTKADVIKLIGEPLRKDCGRTSCYWIYTWQDTATADFDQRWVVFDLNGQIIEIQKSFFID